MGEGEGPHRSQLSQVLGIVPDLLTAAEAQCTSCSWPQQRGTAPVEALMQQPVAAPGVEGCRAGCSLHWPGDGVAERQRVGHVDHSVLPPALKVLRLRQRLPAVVTIRPILLAQCGTDGSLQIWMRVVGRRWAVMWSCLISCHPVTTRRIHAHRYAQGHEWSSHSIHKRPQLVRATSSLFFNLPARPRSLFSACLLVYVLTRLSRFAFRCAVLRSCCLVTSDSSC